MNSFEKPIVDVPFEGSPPIELVLDDLISAMAQSVSQGKLLVWIMSVSHGQQVLNLIHLGLEAKFLHSISEQDKSFQDGMKAARE
tara:strand:+ start:188 stop:442 length:255 start_codon:yes stop_codon:yes gene_type:complete